MKVIFYILIKFKYLNANVKLFQKNMIVIIFLLLFFSDNHTNLGLLFVFFFNNIDSSKVQV